MIKTYLTGQTAFVNSIENLKSGAGNDYSQVRFSIAVRRPYKNADGTYGSDFVNCKIVNPKLLAVFKEHCMIPDGDKKTRNDQQKFISRKLAISGTLSVYNQDKTLHLDKNVKIGDKTYNVKFDHVATNQAFTLTVEDIEFLDPKPNTNSSAPSTLIPNSIEENMPVATVVDSENESAGIVAGLSENDDELPF